MPVASDRQQTPEWLIVGGLMALAAVLRVIAWVQKAVVFDDGPLFLAMANVMREGDWSTVLGHAYHPLYSALIWWISSTGIDPETSAVGISVLCGSLAVGFLYGFLRDSFGRHAAQIGGFLLALHPRAVGFTSDVQSEGLYMALFLGAVWTAWRGLQVRANPATGAGLGLLVGLAYLARPEGLGLAAIGLVAAGVLGFSRRGSMASFLGWSAAFVVAVALTMAPYVVGQRIERGEWLLTPKKPLSSIVPFLEPATPEFREHYTDSMRRAHERIGLPTPPRRGAGDSSKLGSSTRSWRAVTLDWAASSLSALRYDLFLLAVLGMWACRGRPGVRGWFVAAIAIFYLAVLYGLAWNAGYVSRRHTLMPLLPVLGYAAEGVLLGGRVLGGVLDRLWSGRSRPFGLNASRLGVSALILFYIFLALPADLAPRRTESAALRQAAEWLRLESAASGGVAAGRVRIAYYAGAPFVPMPSGGPSEGLAYLRERDVNHLVVGEQEFSHLPWLGEAQPGLVEIHRVQAHDRVGVVFELKSSPLRR